MPEFLLHTIWLNGLFRDFPQTTTDGRQLEVIDPGNHNMDAGPDFSAAQIRMDGVVLVGNVEIHVKSSDWVKHGHHQDAAYDTVILHVVKEADKEIFNSRGEKIAQCELKYPEDPQFLDALLANRKWLCAREWEQEDARIDNWKHTLLQDRMMRKCAAIDQLMLLTHNAWNEAFYVTIAHNFGFHTNSLPFELMAKQTPLNYLMKHRSSVFQLEAILFGQSGLLTAEMATDDYSLRLWKEYCFLQKKFNLVPITGSMWKMGRMRPQNFPHLRIAQFAKLIHQSEHLLSEIIQTDDLKKLRQCFFVIPSEYWQTHYRFGAEVPPAAEKAAPKGTIGKSAVDVLIINTAVPYKYAWGRAHGDKTLRENAFRLLDTIPAEKNHIISQWRTLGVRIRSAADSQAFIHLYQEYCIRQRCLNCDVGYQIFTPSEQK